jgi:hypothetical protein
MSARIALEAMWLVPHLRRSANAAIARVQQAGAPPGSEISRRSTHS